MSFSKLMWATYISDAMILIHFIVYTDIKIQFIAYVFYLLYYVVVLYETTIDSMLRLEENIPGNKPRLIRDMQSH